MATTKATSGRDPRAEKYVQSFRTHIEAPAPLIMPTTLDGIMTSYHNDPAALSRSEESVALLVLALGASCLKDPNGHGPTYATRAQHLILELQDGKGRLDYIWANMLMAVYAEMFGVQRDSSRFLAQARESLVRLVNLNLATLQNRDGPFTRKRNDILFACWTFMLGPSDPEGVLSVNLPLPDATVATNQELAEHVVKDFLRRSALYCLKSQTQAAVKAVKDGRSALDHFEVELQMFSPYDLTIAQAPSRPMSILDARFKLLYWDAQVVLYMPFLDSFCKDDPDVEGLQGLEELEELAHRAVKALLCTVTALGCFPNQPLMLPDITSIAYRQIQNMMVLSRCCNRKEFRPLLKSLSSLLAPAMVFFRSVSDGPSTCRGIRVNLPPIP